VYYGWNQQEMSLFYAVISEKHRIIVVCLSHSSYLEESSLQDALWDPLT